MKDIVKQVKKHWKVLTALAVVLTVSIVGMAMLFANDVVVTLSTDIEEKPIWNKNDTAPVLTANVSLPQDVTVVNEEITWSTSNNDAVGVSNINGNEYETQLVFNGAGYATVTCTYVLELSNGETRNGQVSRNYTIKLETGSKAFQVMQVGTGGNSQIQLYTNYSEAESERNMLQWTTSSADIVNIETKDYEFKLEDKEIEVFIELKRK